MFLLILLVFSFIACVYAIPKIDIAVKEEFVLGEEVDFTYSIDSDLNTNTKIIPFVSCSEMPFPSLDEIEVFLLSDKTYDGTYKSFKVTDEIGSQICFANVRLMEPFDYSESKQFKIKTKSSFEFDVILQKKAFSPGEQIKIDFDSDISTPSATAILTLPDKSTKQLTLPATITADQVGTYHLEATATKEGFKDQTAAEVFAVIGKDAKIGSLQQGIAAANAKNEKFKLKGPIFYALMITIVIIIVFLYFVFKTRRKGDYEPEKQQENNSDLLKRR